MKTALVIISVLAGCMAGIYFGYFFILPSVTVVNASSHAVSSFVVVLPESRLDFGNIEPGEANTIYYSITQIEGRYLTRVETSAGTSIERSCGKVATNEVHKRVTITFTEEQRLDCAGTQHEVEVIPPP